MSAKPQAAPDPESDLLTIPQIAKMAGVALRTASRWASDKTPFNRRLRVIRLGHSTVRVRRADYEKFLTANTH